MKIVIIEDHVMFREVLAKVCRELALEVAGETGEGRQGIGLITVVQPDLLLLDLQLSSLDGFAVAEATQHVSPATRILVLSSHCDDATVFQLEQLHVHGFVDKNSNAIAALKHAIQTVIAGGVSFSAIFERIRQQRVNDPLSFDKVLTNREREILGLLAVPFDDDRIAQRLQIARETVEKHRQNLLRKLGLSSMIDLVRYAQARGFRPLGES